MQKELGVVVERIFLKVTRKRVVVKATVCGVPRILWREPLTKKIDESMGAIAIRFAPNR